MPGFLLRQRGLRRKTIAGMGRPWRTPGLPGRPGRTPQGLAAGCRRTGTSATSLSRTCGPQAEIRRLLAVIDRQSATGKRDYAMMLMTARLGLRISDLRQLGLGDLDWRARPSRSFSTRRAGR